MRTLKFLIFSIVMPKTSPGTRIRRKTRTVEGTKTRTGIVDLERAIATGAAVEAATERIGIVVGAAAGIADVLVARKNRLAGDLVAVIEILARDRVAHVGIAKKDVEGAHLHRSRNLRRS